MKKLLTLVLLCLLVFNQAKAQNKVLVKPCKTCEWVYRGSSSKLVQYVDTKKNKILFEIQNAEAGTLEYTSKLGYIEIQTSGKNMYVAIATNEVFFETDKFLYSKKAKLAGAANYDIQKNFIFLEEAPTTQAYYALYVMKYQNGNPVAVEKIWEEKQNSTNISKKFNENMRDKEDFAVSVSIVKGNIIYFDWEGKNITQKYKGNEKQKISNILQSKYPEALSLKWEAQKKLPNFPTGGTWKTDGNGLLIYDVNGKVFPTPFISKGWLEYFYEGQKKYAEEFIIIETTNGKGIGLLDTKNNYVVIAPDTDLINIEILEKYPTLYLLITHFRASYITYFWTSYKDENNNIKHRIYSWSEGDLLPNKKYMNKFNAYSTYNKDVYEFSDAIYEPVGGVRIILKEYTGKMEGDKELFIYHSFIVDDEKLKRSNRPDKTYGKITLKNNASNAYFNGQIIKGLENVVEHLFIQKQNLLFCRADNNQVFVVDINSGEVKDKLYIRNLETDIYKNFVKNADKYNKENCANTRDGSNGFHLYGIYDLNSKKQILPIKYQFIFINSLGIAALNQCGTAKLFNLNTQQDIKTQKSYKYISTKSCEGDKNVKDCFSAISDNEDDYITINKNGEEE